VSPAGTERVVGGRYRLVRLIAVGGMGEVWQATDERLGRSVAVKLLKPEYGREPTFLARFRAEARHAAGLTHPGIAAVYDYGEVQDQGQVLAYLVMELVDGEPLSQLLARTGALPPALALRIVGQTGLALQAAHDAGVIHRDIKPGNLLIVRVNRDDPSDVQVKVTDFGIARAVDAAPLTRTGMVMGTAHYLSPEQARAGKVTPASDVYSLGVVAFECLTGGRPFTGDTAFAIAAAHAHEPPPPMPGNLPLAVRSLVESAMAKDPAGRPASAGAFGQRALALADQLEGAPAVQPDEATTRLLPAVTDSPLTQSRAVRDTPLTELLTQVGDAPPPARRRRPVWPWLVALLVAALAAAAGYALSADPGGSPSPGVTSHAVTHAPTHPTTTHVTTTHHSASPTTAKSTTPAPKPSVTVDPAAYVGRPYLNDVDSALRRLGLTPTPTSVVTPGQPGTVAGVDPSGVVKAGSTITVQVVATPVPPSAVVTPSAGVTPSTVAATSAQPPGKGGRKSHKPPHG
jgi:eukaryotic-like serine/threonine-protein kinase